MELPLQGRCGSEKRKEQGYIYDKRGSRISSIVPRCRSDSPTYMHAAVSSAHLFSLSRTVSVPEQLFQDNVSSLVKMKRLLCPLHPPPQRGSVALCWCLRVVVMHKWRINYYQPNYRVTGFKAAWRCWVWECQFGAYYFYRKQFNGSVKKCMTFQKTQCYIVRGTVMISMIYREKVQTRRYSQLSFSISRQ